MLRPHTKKEVDEIVHQGVRRLRRFAKQCMALSEVSGNDDAAAVWAGVNAMAREAMIDIKGMCREYYEEQKPVKQETKNEACLSQ